MRQLLALSATLWTLLVVAVSPATAADCGWLAAEELDRLFPQASPWRVTAGGAVGSCQFLSRPDRPPSIFAANQMIEESAASAAEIVANLRAETAKNFETVSRPELGERGFSYSPAGAGTAGSRSVSLIGHRGRIAVIGMLNLQSPVGDRELRAAAELVQAALAVADDPDALAAAADCPWFDAAALERLLPAGGVTQQTYGESSCMAKDSANALLLVSISPASPPLLRRRDASCTWEDLPELGPEAALGHACSAGNPRATLKMTIGGDLVQYNLTPGSEPSAEQRRVLVELATAVRRRLGG